MGGGCCDQRDITGGVVPPHRPGAPLLLSGSRRFVKVEPHFPKLLRRYLGKEEALPPLPLLPFACCRKFAAARGGGGGGNRPPPFFWVNPFLCRPTFAAVKEVGP